MGNPIGYGTDVPKTKVSLINRLYGIFSEGLPFVAPVSTLRTNESELVRSILQMLQGFSSSLFYWDDALQSFHVKTGIYLTHLSKTSLVKILSQFIYGATCLQLVELFVKKVEISHVQSPPTLMAFANSVSLWLKRLRSVALKEEMKSAETDTGTALTLLGLANSLSSLCSGAEYLLQVVQGAIPAVYFNSKYPVPAGEMAVHILDHLYNKLNEVCLVQGGEEEACHMLLVIFVGSLLPYIEGIDSWLYDGTLDDPFEEMFFFANNAIAIDQAAFWEKSYVFRWWSYRKSGPGNSVITSDGESLTIDKKDMGDREPTITSSSVRGKGRNDTDLVACPLFIKDIAKTIVSAGKSLQLIQHVPGDYKMVFDRGDDYDIHDFEPSNGFSVMHPAPNMGGLTLSEVFCISLVGLVGDDSHMCKYFRQERSWTPEMIRICKCYVEEQKLREENGETMPTTEWTEKNWCKFLVETISQRSRELSVEREVDSNFAVKISDYFDETKDANEMANNNGEIDDEPLVRSFWPENPVVSVCKGFLNMKRSSWDKLNLFENFHLPPLNDENLREAIFGGNHMNSNEKLDELRVYGTNYNFGFQFDESEYRRSKDDLKILEALYPFPTLLPCFQEDVPISEVMPFQKNSTLASRVLNWILSVEPKATPVPVVIMQECLVAYIKKQVDYVGKHIMSKLMNGWRLMDELGVLRAIYLLGSGDLLQQFLIMLFDKLDKGDSWDDDFELNTILQESIRNSADGMLISAPDSLVVSITKPQVSCDEDQTAGLVSIPSKARSHSFGINALDLLKFTYKVSWPLELIANLEAIKKYNQVMGFLLKVKRAKFVLDKARRWMWKGRGTKTNNQKHHMLVEQKLLHFVDAFHQYVMDRVFHSAWLELCKGMASAGSLDEVIEVHEAYLLSIQRQCFVAPDKLWALIASRIKSILGLALDFYSIQQTLCTGGVAPVIRARCEMEVDRIEKQFDDCIAFLLRVLSFKLNVGQFPHLADLVTRINYNYFYMSDNGNLLTVPGIETTASKLGKTFPPRTD